MNDVPVIQFLPVMNGSTQRINCSVSSSFQPSLQIIFNVGSKLQEIKLPQESMESQTTFEYSHFENSMGCGNVSNDMHCYAFPITVISDDMDGAMVVCGARKENCPVHFIRNIGIIRVNKSSTHPGACFCTTNCSSLANSSITSEQSNAKMNNTNATCKSTDTTINVIISLSCLIAVFTMIIGVLVCLLVLCVVRLHCFRSSKSDDHQNQRNFNADLGRYPQTYR